MVAEMGAAPYTFWIQQSKMPDNATQTVKNIFMRSASLILAAVMGLLLHGPAHAQQTQPESVQLYDVELILFAREAPDAGSTEAWPEEPGMPDYQHAIPIQEQDATTSATMKKNAGTAQQPVFQLLPKEAYLLTAEARRINRKRGLHTLLHIAWRQPGLAPNKAIPVYLRSAETTETNIPRLEGTVTISRQRYLHVKLDLLLNKSRFNSESDTPYLAETVSYRFQGRRKMRSGKLHYIDHPLAGALIKIEKYTPPEPEPEPEPGIVATPDAAATPATTPATIPPTTPGAAPIAPPPPVTPAN